MRGKVRWAKVEKMIDDQNSRARCGTHRAKNFIMAPSSNRKKPTPNSIDAWRFLFSDHRPEFSRELLSKCASNVKLNFQHRV
jgi:hypothetical protein